MNRTFKYIGVAVVVAVVGCTCTIAADRPHLPKGQRGDVVLTADIWHNVDSTFTALPVAVDGSQSVSTHGEMGPVMLSSKGGSLSAPANGASSIPGMSLGSILTPQDRTNISIRKTIRRLG